MGVSTKIVEALLNAELRSSMFGVDDTRLQYILRVAFDDPVVFRNLRPFCPSGLANSCRHCTNSLVCFRVPSLSGRELAPSYFGTPLCRVTPSSICTPDY
ncbi:uncharacterized protein N7518_003439 [Penicillium psychrosexuale]|uniref:uncharacterized protein n=1 Tax=Penicillium psychrosexuale TaxID=1002107 RepID=UPI00254569E3|nr:uncharacterized protein N7518_003439 [Penicillium psychrosexuale]KAJ5801371.1 hypothetical protein N7518_003439 [Penicillium psychrosexuale]